MIQYFEAFSRCIIALLFSLHSCILSLLHLSPVQTETCNYPDCHLIAAASISSITVCLSVSERERENVMIAFSAGIGWNSTMFLSFTLYCCYHITMPAVPHTLSVSSCVPAIEKDVCLCRQPSDFTIFCQTTGGNRWIGLDARPLTSGPKQEERSLRPGTPIF